MQRLVIGVLAIALLGAAATVYFVHAYITAQTPPPSQVIVKSNAVEVLVAKDNLPIGKKLEAGDLDWQLWPESGTQKDFLSAPKGENASIKRAAVKKVLGSVARRSIIKGTPITKEAIFKSTNPGFLAGALDRDMRAMAVAVTAQSGAAGFILPGDRVDVILTQNLSKKSRSKSGGSNGARLFDSHVAETILHNVRVLASDQKVSDFEKKAQVAKTVTLEVTPKQAETLAVAGMMGKLSLVLRSFSDVTDARATATPGKKAIFGGPPDNNKRPTTTTDLEVSPLLAGSLSPRPVVGKATKPGRARPAPIPVRIYRGDKSSEPEKKEK